MSITKDVPDDTAAAPGLSFKDRTCPNIRSWYPMNLFSSFNLHTPDRGVLVRRVTIWIALGLDTLISVLLIINTGLRFSIIIRIVLSVLGFFFMAYCLHLVERMSGARKVLGIVFDRWHFDMFLLLLALYELGLVVWLFSGLPVWGFWGMSIGAHLALLVVAWVSTWRPEGASVV